MQRSELSPSREKKKSWFDSFQHLSALVALQLFSPQFLRPHLQTPGHMSETPHRLQPFFGRLIQSSWEMNWVACFRLSTLWLLNRSRAAEPINQVQPRDLVGKVRSSCIRHSGQDAKTRQERESFYSIKSFFQSNNSSCVPAALQSFWTTHWLNSN